MSCLLCSRITPRNNALINGKGDSAKWSLSAPQLKCGFPQWWNLMYLCWYFLASYKANITVSPANFLPSEPALSVQSSAPSTCPKHGAKNKGNAWIFFVLILPCRPICCWGQSTRAKLYASLHADSGRPEDLGESRTLSREHEKSPKCGRESWQKWNGGLLSKACTGSRRTELAICYAENLWVCL